MTIERARRTTSRRRGIARQLVTSVEAALSERGAGRMTILVFHHEAGAVSFWEALGYLADPATRRFAKALPGRSSSQ